MGEAISKFIRWILDSKKHIVFAVFAFLFFLVFLFPFDDLSDYITEQIAKNTQNQVFVAFSDLGISLLPLGLSFEEVSVDTPVVPTLKADRLSLAPSIMSFLAFKPGFVADAKGLFGGDVELNFKTGEEIRENLYFQNINLEFSEANLKQIGRFANSPLPVQGEAAAEISGEIDPSFGAQPKSEYLIEIKNLRVPPSTVPTALGPLSLPNLQFSQVSLKGRMVNGELIIEESQIGDDKDNINGRIKGKFAVNISKVGTRIVPRFGAYELKLDLNFSRQAEKDLGIFMSLYDKYKTLTGTGARYAFQLNGVNFRANPQASPLRQF